VKEAQDREGVEDEMRDVPRVIVGVSPDSRLERECHDRKKGRGGTDMDCEKQKQAAEQDSDKEE
jgi:hypothetical protein